VKAKDVKRMDRMTSSSEQFILENVRVERNELKRTVRCLSCDQTQMRSFPVHMRKFHPAEWEICCQDFLRLYNQGNSLSQIMKRYGTLFTWKVIDREIKRVAEKNGIIIKARPTTVKDLAPKKFTLECSSVWRFPKRGNWAVHDGSYRGNWAPQVPRNLILHYTRKGDTVVDPFVGGGTTLIECVLLKRKGIGVDISPHAVNITRQKLRELRKSMPKQDIEFPRVFRCDARHLSMITDESVDFVCGQPPYANAVRYTSSISEDLSRIGSLSQFCAQIREVARELYRVLKKRKRCAVLVGDVRRKKMVFPLGFKVMEQFLAQDFDLEEIIVKEQHNDRSTRFYATKPSVLRFRIAHEYLFVFKKR